MPGTPLWPHGPHLLGQHLGLEVLLLQASLKQIHPNKTADAVTPPKKNKTVPPEPHTSNPKKEEEEGYPIYFGTRLAGSCEMFLEFSRSFLLHRRLILAMLLTLYYPTNVIDEK